MNSLVVSKQLQMPKRQVRKGRRRIDEPAPGDECSSNEYRYAPTLFVISILERKSDTHLGGVCTNVRDGVELASFRHLKLYVFDASFPIPAL